MKKPCNNCKHAKSYQYSSGKIHYYCGIWIYDNIACRNCERRQKYEDFLESRRQYTRGKRIESVSEYLALKEQGQSLFYWGNKIRHFGWLESLQFRTLVSVIKNGDFYMAIKKVNSNNTL